MAPLLYVEWGSCLGRGEGGSIVCFQTVPLISFLPSLQSPFGLRLHRQSDSHLILPINVSIGWGFLRVLLVTAVTATRWCGSNEAYIHDGVPRLRRGLSCCLCHAASCKVLGDSPANTSRALGSLGLHCRCTSPHLAFYVGSADLTQVILHDKCLYPLSRQT